jgi:hypothetical protein
MILRLLGVVDILTALFILFNIYPPYIGLVFFLIHFGKGVASLGADPVGQIYGIVDIVSAFMILLSLNLPLLIEAPVMGVLMFKGITSLI